MSADQRKTKAELIEELRRLRRQAEKVKALRQQLKDLRADCSELQVQCTEQNRTLEDECRLRDRTEEALRLAEMIIAQSPVVLFRRRAGKTPKLVYVSSNIIQFGYAAEELLNGRVKFSEIVHPDDRNRLVEEVTTFTESDVEDYTQCYRMVTRSGEVRWVEDRTSVVRDGRKNSFPVEAAFSRNPGTEA